LLVQKNLSWNIIEDIHPGKKIMFLFVWVSSKSEMDAPEIIPWHIPF